ncbi:MAG: tetratricopeptide repeat protein, partial [Bryobacteraceae bacterium]
MNQPSVESIITILTHWTVKTRVVWLLLLPLCAFSDSGTFDRNVKSGAEAVGRHQFQEAEWSLRAALSEAEGFAENDPRVRKVLNALIEVYRIEGKYAEAEPLLERMVAFDERTAGEDTFRLADTLEDQGQVLLATGQGDRAEQAFRRALGIREETLGADNEALIEPLHNIIRALQAQEKFADAEPLAQRAIRIRAAKQGPEASDVAAEFSLLARLYAALGKFAEAAAPLESA